jgi:hypothetical protein
LNPSASKRCTGTKGHFIVESRHAQAAWFTNLSGYDFGDPGVLTNGSFAPIVLKNAIVEAEGDR